MPPSNKKSELWQYFAKINNNEVKCKTCFKTIKTSGNTSNMNKHLKKHPNPNAPCGKGDNNKQTINKNSELPNPPSHEPQSSTSTSKAPELDKFLTTPSPSDVESAPIYDYDSEFEETCAPLPKKRYQKAWSHYIKYRHLIANMTKPSYKEKLLDMEAKLQEMRTQSKMKRDVTVAISYDGFHTTGLVCDI